MSAAMRHKLIQANSPKVLEEEVARFAKEGWHKSGETMVLVPTEVGRPTYWAQTLDLLAEATTTERGAGDLHLA
jgi:hypothetical protein